MNTKIIALSLLFVLFFTLNGCKTDDDTTALENQTKEKKFTESKVIYSQSFETIKVTLYTEKGYTGNSVTYEIPAGKRNNGQKLRFVRTLQNGFKNNVRSIKFNGYAGPKGWIKTSICTDSNYKNCRVYAKDINSEVPIPGAYLDYAARYAW
jgi:hypothetical protein